MKKTQIVTTMAFLAMGAFLLAGCAGKKAEEPEPIGMSNPWQYEVSPEEIQKMVNESFTVPEDAENVVYGIMESEKLAEVQFDIDGVSYCARMEPADKFTDISGIYATWDSEENEEINGIDATYRRSITEEEWYDNILYYDAAGKMMHSISATAPDLDGFDLMAVAETIFQ